jgi:tRNA nucleotidyltransferase (CCA-adding enzyme)
MPRLCFPVDSHYTAFVTERVPVPKPLQDLSRVFSSGGFRVYLVGGAVRDSFLGKAAEDWDVATDATPADVADLFRRVIPTGIEHGTVTIPFQSHMIECTTFRTETAYSDGRHPDGISYATTIEEDLSRRDFTMNAIAVSLPDGNIVDPFGGRADIGSKLIRTVGDPRERFAEDGLRPLRAVRFSSQLGFSIHPDTLAAIPAALPVTGFVAQERIRDELVKMLSAPLPSRGLRFMEMTGLLEIVLPELASCRGVEQKGLHRFDVLDHLLHTCDACPQDSIELRLAGLFHDIGKPAVRATGADGTYTFYNHETESARIADSVMNRLRFPQKTTKRTCHLIAQHMFHYESNWTDAAVRRFIVRAGEDAIGDLFALRRADCRGITGIAEMRADVGNLSEFGDRIRKVITQEHAFSLKDLAVNGHDLARIGIPPGPMTGQILAEMLETVLDDPALNTKERLIEIAQAIAQRRLDARG